MRNPFALLAGALLLAAASSAPVSVQTLAKPLLEGCASELETHCAAVTPGEGRLLKLSGPCELALYDTAVRLERAISTLTYVASQCRAEIGSLCAGMQAGRGRIAQCLHDHAAELSGPCDRALAHVGLKE